MATATIVFTDKPDGECVDVRLNFDEFYTGAKNRTQAERLAAACLAAVLLGEIDLEHKICKKNK